ncbi:MAG: VWA domain-containing protein, partial [bacterium]|nr:VWA domain-containing protein [bacterium]
ISKRLNNSNTTLSSNEIVSTLKINNSCIGSDPKGIKGNIITENDPIITFSDITLTELFKSRYDALKSIQVSFKIHSHSNNEIRDISIQFLKENNTEYNITEDEVITSISPGSSKLCYAEIPSHELETGLNPILIEISYSDGNLNNTIYIDFVKYNYFVSSYKDVELYRSDYSDIMELINKGIIDEVSNDEFRPNSFLSRGEFCKMIVKGKNLPINNNTANGTFADVSSGNPYYDYVMTLLNMGIIQSNENFYVDQAITNAEIAKMVLRVFGRPEYFDDLEASPFNDVNYNGEPETSGYYISAIKKSGLMRGNCNGSFYPELSSTRANACVVINKGVKALSSSENDYNRYSNECSLGAQPTECIIASGSKKYIVKSGDVIKVSVNGSDNSNNYFVKGKGKFNKIDDNNFEWIVPDTYISQIVEIFGGATNGEYTQTSKMYFQIEPTDSIIDYMNNEKLDISHVVDVSGSMRSAMDVERASVKAQISLLEEGDNISVISFNSTAKLISPRQVIQDQATKSSIISSLNGLISGGGTSIGAGLEMAIQHLNLSINKNKYIILFSDGQEYSPPMVNEVLENINSSITVFCLGYSYGADQALLDMIAREKNGKFLFIQDVKDVNSAYLAILSIIKGLDIIASGNKSELDPISTDLFIDSVYIDDSISKFSSYFTRTNTPVTHKLISPSGKEISIVNASLNHNIDFKYDSLVESFTIRNPEDGLWKTSRNHFAEYLFSPSIVSPQKSMSNFKA